MARGYHQYCPLAKGAEIFAERWTPLVVRELLHGATRFSEIERGVPLMSKTLLSQRLRTLERAGIVERRPSRNGRGSEYHLTQAGEELRTVVDNLGAWGKRWAQHEIAPDERDPGVLMWDLHRSINVGKLPDRRIVVQFEFPDAPKNKRRYWLVLDATGVDLCMSDPGFGIDVIVTTDCLTLILVQLGDVSFDRAMGDGSLRVQGPRDLVRDLPAWFTLSSLATVPRPRAIAR